MDATEGAVREGTRAALAPGAGRSHPEPIYPKKEAGKDERNKADSEAGGICPRIPD